MNDINLFVTSRDIDCISDERKAILNGVADFIRSEIQARSISLAFICTHNSRRSQLCQAWAHFFTNHFNLKQIKSCSAGTEQTAVFEEIICTLNKTGFDLKTEEKKENSKYYCSRTELILFSKTIEQLSSNQKNIVAVMTCDDADQNCPTIKNAIKRFSLPFNDPKRYDHRENRAKYYDDTNKIIAGEMCYLFSRINRD